uniref:Uncharacterized protein n=1 Tax=Musa acuminata subsp. malaccensis TaxID=214687 RepID=A0A804I3D2_MUSAM|nr:PREDICTED: uncharacterized protein LOC103976263 [Musa acuminata subsp. malaccensis]
MAAEAGVEEAILEEKLQHQSGDLGYVQNPSSFIEKEVIDSKEHQNPISVVFYYSQTIGPSQTYGAEAATGEGITIDEKAKNENLHSIAIGILDKSEGEVFVEAPSRDQIPFSNDADVDLHGNNSVEGKKEDLESAILVKKERENEVQERKEESATENNLSLSEKMHEIEKMESPEAEQVQNHGTLEDQIENREQESAVAMTSPEKIDTREITENEVARKEGKIEDSLDKKLEESCKVPESENVRQDVPRPVSVNELHSSTADDKTVQDQEITHTSNEKETVIQKEDENDARNFNASPYSHLRNQIESITEERKAEELQETSEVVQNKDQLQERGISQEEMEPHRVNSDMQLSQAQNEEVDEQDEAKITQTNQNESHDMEVSLGLLGQKFIHEMKEKIRDMEMIASGGETNEAEAIMTDEADARMNVDEEQKRMEEHNEFNEMKQEKQTFEDNMQIDTCHGTLTKHSPDNVLEDDKCQEKFEISNNEIPEKIIMSKIGVSIEEAAGEPPEKTQVPQEEGEEVVTAEETIAKIITEDPSSIPHCEDEKVPEMVNAYYNTETSQEDNLKKDAKDTPTNDTPNLHKVYDPAVRKLEETPSCVAEELIQQTTTTKDNVDIQLYKESTEPENLAVISNSMNKDQNGKSEELRLDNSRKDDKPQDEGGIEKTAGDIPVTVCKKQEDSHSVAEEQNNQTKDFDDNKKDDVNREKMESENLEIAPDLVHEEKMQQSVNELEAEGTHNFTNDVNHNDMASQIHVVFHDNETAKAKNDSILDNKMDENFNKYELVMDDLIEKNEQPLNSDRKTDTLQVSREILEETLHIINEKHEDDKHEVRRNMDLIDQDPISETVEEICRMTSGEQIHEAIADKNIMNFANSQGIVYMNKEVGSSSFTQNPLEENTLGAAILEESDKNIYDETSVEVALEDTHETKEANKRIEGFVSTDELAYKVRGVTFGEEQKEGEELNKIDELKGGEETIKEISSAISPPNTMDEYLDHVHQNDKSEKEHENTEAEVLETTILAEINSSTRELVEEKDLPNQQEESFEEKAKIWTPQEEALVGSNIAKASDSRENEDAKISDIIHVNINKEPTRDNDKDMNNSISDVPDTDDLVGQYIQAVNNNQEIVLDFKCKEKIEEASHTKESTVADNNIEEACQKLESISELVNQSKTPEGTSEVMMSQNSKNDANLSADIIDASEITENKEFAKMEQPQVSQGNVDILATTEASIIQDQMISKYDEGICSMQHKEDSLQSEDGIQNTNMDKGEDEKDTIEVSHEEENLGGDCHIAGSVNTRDNIPRAVSVDESHPTPTAEDKTFQDQEITDTEGKKKNVIWTEDESEDSNFDAFYAQLPRQEDSGVEEENHENLELTFELEKNKDQDQETLDVLDEMGLHSVESDMQIFNTQKEEVNDQDEADDNHMQMNQTECHDVEVSSEVIVHEVVLEDKTDEAEARMNLDEENKKYNQDNELIQGKEASEDNMQVNACDGAPINQTLNDTLEIDKCKENIEISSIEITEKTIEYEIYASIEEDAAAAEKEHSVKSKLPQEESEAVLTTEKAVARISIEDPSSIPDNEDEKVSDVIHINNDKEPTRDTDKDKNNSISDEPDTDDLVGQHIQAVNNNQEIVLDFECKEQIEEASHTKESTVADNNIEDACQKLESISELVHQSKTPEGTSEVMMSQNSKNDANLSADIIDASEITENKDFAKMEQPQVSQGNVDILTNTEASIIQDQMISKYDEGICSMQQKEDSLPSEDGIQNTNMDKGEDEKDTIEVSHEEENLGGDCHIAGSVNTRDNRPRAVSVDESHPTPTAEDKTFQDQEITDTEDKKKNVIWTEDESEDSNFDAFYAQLPRQEDSGVEEENHENLEVTFELEKNKDQGQETLDVLDEMGLHSVESDMQIFNTQNEEVYDQDEADDNHMQMNQTECHDVEVSSEVIVHEVVLEDKTDEAEARTNLDEENQKYNQDNELIQGKEASEDNIQVNACDGAPINQTLNDTVEIDKCKENIEISSIEITEKTIEYEIYASIEEDAVAAEKEHSVKSKLPQEESEAVLTTEKAVARISIEDPSSIPDNEDEKNPEILNAYDTETAKEVHLKKSLEDNPTNNVPILEKVYDPVVREPEGTPCCVAEELAYQSTTTKDNMDIQMYQDTTMAEKIAIISNSMSENQNGKSEETSFDNSSKDDKPQDEEGLEKNIGEVPETWITNDEILNNMASEIHVVNNDQETATAIQEDSISYVANEQINQTTDTDDNKKDEAYKERVEYEKIELTTDMAHENQMQQLETDDNLNNMEASEIHDANNDQETATAKNDNILEDKMNENYSKHELIMDCFIEKNEQALISGNNADTSPVPRKMIEETLQITNEMHEDNKDELCKVMEPVEQDPISENGEEICRTFLATILAEVNAFAGELVEGKDLSEEQGEKLQKKTEIPQEEAPAGTSIAEASSDTKNEDAKISDAVHVNDHKEPTRENDEDMNNSISDVPDTDQLVGQYIQGANNNQEIVLDSECKDSTVEESCQKLESISEVVHQSITHKGTSELIMSENSENHANLSPEIVDASEIIENKESRIEQPQVSQGNIDILADTEAPIIQKDQVMTKYEEGTCSMPHEENSLPTEGDIQDSNLDKGEDEKDTIEVLHEKENLEGDCQVAESVNTRDNIPRAVSVDESHPVPTAEDKTFQDQEITHTENKKENAIQKVEKSDVSNSDASYYLQLPKQEDSTTEERNSEKLQEIFELVPKTDQFQEKVALNEMELHTVKSDVQIFHTQNEEVNDQDKADDKYTQKNQNQNEETENNRSKIMIALEDETDEAGARMNLDEEKKKHDEDNELKQEKQASEENMQMKTCDETPTDQTLDDVQEKEVCKANVEVSSIEIPDKILKYEIGTSILEVAAAAEKEHSEKSELRQVDEAVLTSEREVTRTNTEDPSSIPDFEDEKVPEMASIYHDNETTKVMDGGNLEQNVEAAPTSDIPVLQSIHDQVAKETEEKLNCVAEELIHQTTTTQDNIDIDTYKGSAEAEKLFISNSVKEECNYKSEEIDLDNLRKDDTTQVYEIHDRENDQETAKAKDDNILENNMEDDSNKYEMVMDSFIQKNEQAANLDKNIGTSLMPKKFIEETVQIRNEMHEDGNDSVSENMDLIEQHLVSRSVEELYKAFSGEQNHEAIADTEITDVVNSLDNVNMDRIVGSLCSTQTPLEKTTGKASSPQESLDADLEDKHEKVEANKGMECVVSNDEQTNKLMVEGTSIEEQKEGEEINKKNELNQQEDSLMMVEGTSIEEQKEGEELNKKNELNQQEETIKEDMDSEIFLENTTKQFPQNVIKNDTAEVLDRTISAEVNASTRELTEQKDPTKEQEKSLQEKAGVCTPQEEAQVGIGVAHLSDNPDKKDEKASFNLTSVQQNLEAITETDPAKVVIAQDDDCRMTQKMEFQATESELTTTSQHVVRKTTKDQEAVKNIDEKVELQHANFKHTESSAHGKLETTTETGLVEVEPSCDENISDTREDSLCTMEASDMNTIQINIAEVTSEAHQNVSREDNETKETALLENENRKEQEVDKCLPSNKTKNEEEERNYLNPPEVKVSGKIYTNECIEDRTQEKKIKESGSQVESMKDVETENVLNIFYAMDEINKENKSVMDAENNEDQEDETRLESEEDEDKEEDNIQPDMKVYEAATTSEYNEENIKEKTTVKSVSESQKLEDVEAKNPIYMVPDELEIADKDTCTDEQRQGEQLNRADLEEKFEKNKDRARKAVEEVGPFSSNEQIHACDATDNLSPQEQITKIVDSDMTIEDNHRKMVDDPCITAEFHEEMKNVAKFLPQMETLDFKSLKETETSENFVSQDVRGSGQNEISGLNFQDYPRKVMKLQQQSDEEVDGLKIEYPIVENENIIPDDNNVPEPEVSGVKDAASEHVKENNDESNDMEPKDMLEAKRSVTIPQQSQKKMINKSDNISSDQGPIIMDPSEKRGTTTLIDEEERNGSFVIIETDGEVIKYGDKDLDEVSEFLFRESTEGNIETQAMHVEAANDVGINETGEKCHDETSISLLPSEAIVTRDQDDRVNLEETLKSESDVSIAEKDDHSVEFRENKELLGNLSTTQATETSILEDEKDRLEEAEGPSCEVAGLNRSKSEEYELIDHDDLPVSHLMEGILQGKRAKLGGVEAEAKVEENISVQSHDTSIPKQDSILVSRSTEHVREDTSTKEDKVGKKFEDSSGLMLECSHDNVIGNNTKELIITEDDRPERNTNDDSPASKVGGNVYEDFSKADSLHHDEKIQTSIIGKTSGIPMHENKENKMDIFSKEGGIEDMRIFKGVEKIDQDSNALLHEQLAFTSEPDEDAKILDNGEQSQLNLQTDEIGKYDSLIIDNTIEGTKIQSKGVKIESSREDQDAINELRIQNVKSDLNEQYMSIDSHEVQKLDTFVKSTDKVVQEEKFKEEISPKVLMDERQTNKTTDTQLDDDKTDEENDEKEDEDDHKIMESSHDSAVPVEARDAVLKPAHKKSHNILSGVTVAVQHRCQWQSQQPRCVRPLERICWRQRMHTAAATATARGEPYAAIDRGSCAGLDAHRGSRTGGSAHTRRPHRGGRARVEAASRQQPRTGGGSARAAAASKRQPRAGRGSAQAAVAQAVTGRRQWPPWRRPPARRGGSSRQADAPYTFF